MCCLYSAEDLRRVMRGKHVLARIRPARRYDRKAGEVLHTIKVSCTTLCKTSGFERGSDILCLFASACWFFSLYPSRASADRFIHDASRVARGQRGEARREASGLRYLLGAPFRVGAIHQLIFVPSGFGDLLRSTWTCRCKVSLQSVLDIHEVIAIKSSKYHARSGGSKSGY